jgi:alanine racemase
MSHRAVALIDSTALRENVALLDSRSGDAALLVVVKADAYGHGIGNVAPILRRSGVAWLGVALLSEAVQLRALGDIGRILAWLWAPGDPDLEPAIAAEVDISVSSMWALREVLATGERLRMAPRVHLKLDTGLSRNGVPADEWEAVVSAAADAQARGALLVEGVWSHLANADQHESDDAIASVVAQAEAFRAGLAVVAAAGLTPPHLHLANSAATAWFPDLHFTMVRCGIATYGVSPGVHVDEAKHLGLKPVMTLRAQLAHVKTIPAGQSVSYGSHWTAADPTRIGLVAVGYADGIPRTAEGAQVSVHGRRADVLGRIAMDQFVIELTDDAEPGQWVTVFGADGPSADEWAHAAGTIGYEIVTRIGPRVPRELV